MLLKELKLSKKEHELASLAYCTSHLHGSMLIGVNAKTGESSAFCFDDNVYDVVDIRAKRSEGFYDIRDDFDVDAFTRFFEVKEVDATPHWNEVTKKSASFNLQVHEDWINSEKRILHSKEKAR